MLYKQKMNSKLNATLLHLRIIILYLQLSCNNNNIMISIKQNPDILGTLTSSLCLIHCAATPFFFIAQTYTAGNFNGIPRWWGFIDYFFLFISFFAIYWSIKTTTLNWIKPMLWSSWFVLLLIIVNEKVKLLPLPEVLIYIPSISLMVLHLYNKKYCNCNNDKCCTNER